MKNGPIRGFVYFCRSLERYAPWIRNIYLVTNGQIPHWINLDHPRLKIITHEEIFEDKSNLPTFSSPAIEAHLHLIPGLSEKFLYFNDDVFLGQEIWPSDFYDPSLGQKVYFSWPLPDCAPGCANSWIKDGYCDTVCNTTKCMFDGGDCLGKDIKMGFGEEAEVQTGNEHSQCALGCLDPWLSDGFCDDGCNVIECAFDAGDCGDTNYLYLHQEFENLSQNDEGFQTFQLPTGTTVSFWNLTNLFQAVQELALVPLSGGGSGTAQDGIRAAALNHQLHLLTLVLRNETSGDVNITLQGRSKSSSQEALIFNLNIKFDTFGHVPMLIEPKEETADKEMMLDFEKIRQTDIDLDFSNVDEHKLNVSQDIIENLDILQDQLKNEEITLKGYGIKKSALLQRYVRRYLARGGKLKDLDEINEDYSVTHPQAVQRKLMDAYGDSMLHVNTLYTEEYGFANRLAIAHMPHLFDRKIFAQLYFGAKFKQQWRKTASHQIRQSDDMQLAFSYFHYLINEKQIFDIHDIFKKFDTDETGTWSDREIRTILTRIHSLPLSLDHINAFEKIIMHCHENLDESEIPEQPKPKVSNVYERYYDSKLPLVTEFLISHCQSMIQFLNETMGDLPKYQSYIMDTKTVEDQILFAKISSNVSQVVATLDNLRKHPKKFVCLNDNTDPPEDFPDYDKRMVQAVLIDYLESVYPIPSSFELPSDYRNKFLHTFEYQRWQLYRILLKLMTYFCVILLLVILISAFFKIDIDAKVAKWLWSKQKPCSTV